MTIRGEGTELSLVAAFARGDVCLVSQRYVHYPQDGQRSLPLSANETYLTDATGMPDMTPRSSR